MTLILVGLLALGASCAEPVFLRPVPWLGDLVITEQSLVLGSTGQVVEMSYQGEILRVLPFPAGQIQALALGPGFLAAGGWNLLRLWTWPAGEILLDIQGFGTMIKDLAIAGSLILAAGADGRVLAFSLSGEVLWSMRAHEGTVWGIAATSELFATAGSDRAALWDLESKKEVHTFPGRTWEVDFSPDGFLLAGGAGKILKLWDTALGLPLLEIWAHESCTVAVAFSPDGRKVATGSLDQSAALWDAESGQLLKRITGFTAIVRAVGFSPDGRLLAAGAEDGTIALLRLP